ARLAQRLQPARTSRDVDRDHERSLGQVRERERSVRAGRGLRRRSLELTGAVGAPREGAAAGGRDAHVRAFESDAVLGAYDAAAQATFRPAQDELELDR